MSQFFFQCDSNFLVRSLLLCIFHKAMVLSNSIPLNQLIYLDLNLISLTLCYVQQFLCLLITNQKGLTSVNELKVPEDSFFGQVNFIKSCPDSYLAFGEYALKVTFFLQMGHVSDTDCIIILLFL